MNRPGPADAVRRWSSELAAPLAVGALIVAVFMPLSPAYDLAVFIRAGHALLGGGAVYPSPGSPAVYSGSAFVYPYLAAYSFVPLALVPREAAIAAFFALSFGALTAACLAQAHGDGRRVALVLGTSFAVSGLQLGALSPLLVAGALVLWRVRERPWLLAAVAGPVIASKLFLAPLLSWMVLARRWRAAAGACLSAAAVLAASFVLGPMSPVAYLRLLSALGAHESAAGFGLIGALRRSGWPLAAADAAAALSVAVLLAAARRHARRHGDERVLFCAALLAALALSPVLWSHYLLLLAAVMLVLELPWPWLAVLCALSWLTAPAHGIRIGDDQLTAMRPALVALVAVVLVGVFARSRGAFRRRGGGGVAAL